MTENENLCLFKIKLVLNHCNCKEHDCLRDDNEFQVYCVDHIMFLFRSKNVHLLQKVKPSIS